MRWSVSSRRISGSLNTICAPRSGMLHRSVKPSPSLDNRNARNPKN